MKRFLIFMPVLAGLLACSIKEERKDCPCRIEIDITEFLPYDSDPDVSLVGPKGRVHLSRNGNIWSGNAEKGDYELSVTTAGPHTTVGSNLVSVTRESEPDSLYAYAGVLSCLGERMHVTPPAQKQFCTVHLQEKNGDGRLFRYPVKCSRDGFFRFDLTPSEGTLQFWLQVLEDGTGRFRLSRQDRDADVILKVSHPEAGERAIDLGAMMLQAGYDWTETNLKDFYLEIDPALLTLEVRIEGWEEGRSEAVTI